MDHFKKTLDDGLRRIRGKIELVKKPHVGVKEWLETHIPKTASTSFMSLTTINDQSNGESSTTSGPSTCSNVDTSEAFQIAEMPAKPSRFLSMNVELVDIFEDDDADRMRVILEKGLDPNFVDIYGKPLIYRAVEDRKYNILDTMLDFGFGCDVNTVTTCQNDVNGGWAALHLACHLGDLRALQILLGVHQEYQTRRDVCDVNAVDTDIRSPLHILCSSATWIVTDDTLPTPQSASTKPIGNVFDFTPGGILEFHSDSSKCVDGSNACTSTSDQYLSKTTPTEAHTFNASLHSTRQTNQNRSTQSTHAKQTISKPIVESKLQFERQNITTSNLLKHERVSCKTKEQEDTHHVTQSRSSNKLKPVSAQAQMMKLLIKAGSDVNAQDHCSDTALHICASKGNLEGAKILLKNGADIDIVDDMCETPLVKSIIHHHPPVVKTLLKMEHSISDIKRYELSELLLTLIEDINNNPQEKNEDKVIDILKALTKKRIFLNVTDSRRRTPLHLSVLYGCHGVASSLIHQPSCDINKQDDEGFTPLFLVAWDPKKVGQSGHKTVLYELLSRGANVNQHDFCGVLPINAALESGHYENTCILLANGSHVNSDKWFCSSVEMLRRNSSTLPFVERFVLSMINNYHHYPTLIEVAAILGKMSIVEGIVKCGVRQPHVNSGILHRWIQNESHDYLVSDLMENMRILSHMCKGMLSLKDLCRLKIRSHINKNLHRKVSQLPLPDVLQSFIKMSGYCETVQ